MLDAKRDATRGSVALWKLDRTVESLEVMRALFCIVRRRLIVAKMRSELEERSSVK